MALGDVAGVALHQAHVLGGHAEPVRDERREHRPVRLAGRRGPDPRREAPAVVGGHGPVLLEDPRLAAAALDVAGDPDAEGPRGRVVASPFLLGPPRPRLEQLDAAVEAGLVVAAVVAPAGRGVVGELADQVAAAQLHRVRARRGRQLVDGALHRVRGLRAPRTAVGERRGRRREPRADGRVDLGHRIGLGGRHPGLAGQRRAERVGADVGVDLQVDREEPAVRVRGDADVLVLPTAAGGRREGLGAVLDPAHRDAEPARGRDDREVLRVGRALGAERAARVGDDDADVGGVEVERPGDARREAVRVLVRAVDREPLAVGLDEDRPRLERGGREQLLAQ